MDISGTFVLRWRETRYMLIQGQSIDLTRLPAASPSASEGIRKASTKTANEPSVEYSSREVSPPALLLQQLLQANQIFKLHHGQSITDLCIRVPRGKFRSTLDRFWTRFCKHWDVLLHGNPAADVFNGIRLASGGELGMGVGEEEWGSGERDVLEDLVRRTEGLVDLVVSRFGDPATPKEDTSTSESELLPWMGSGNHPVASDGVIFSGINAITRPSLRSVALWMAHIYAYGEYAYGVRDNPLRERRKRKRRDLPEREMTPTAKAGPTVNIPRPAPEIAAKDYGFQSISRPASDTASCLSQQRGAPRPVVGEQNGQPGIPPPIVSAAEQSLAKATKKADAYVENSLAPDTGTTMGIPDQYMKYLTFGLSTFGKSVKQERPGAPRRTSTSSSKTITAQRYASSKLSSTNEDDENDSRLTEVDPIPDGDTLQAKIAKQKRGEERGQFLVGMTGELDNAEEAPNLGKEDEENEEATGLRNVLRTLQVELNDASIAGEAPTELQRKLSEAGLSRGRDDPANFRRLRVLVYVHRPFIYCFLFESQTPALGMTSFYQDLHHNLTPIYKPLLLSTSPASIAQRIQEAQISDTASVMSGSRVPDRPSPIYDLIYDPALLTVRTSVPNVPEPGTPAAEGIVPGTRGSSINSPSLWTRIESLNVHSQILKTISSIQRNSNEYERTSKTSRGWWIVWMKLSPSLEDDGKGEEETGASLEHVDSDETTAPTMSDSTYSAFENPGRHRTERKNAMNRIAILVRKASDNVPAAPKNTSRAVSSMWNSLSLKSNPTADAITGGSSAGWGPQALAGGIGVDARKYIEGLLSLGR